MTDFNNRHYSPNMTSARIISGEDIKHVRLPNSFVSEEFIAELRAAREKESLFCGGCDEAQVTFVKGHKRAIGGTVLKSCQAHFRTVTPHSDGCRYPMMAAEAVRKEYNTALGWRLHLNTHRYTPLLPQENTVYYIDGKNHLQPRLEKLPAGETVENFKQREPKSMKSAQDFVDLISYAVKNGHTDRLQNSLVIHKGFCMKWSDFLIRQGQSNAPDKAVRYRNLVSRLSASVGTPALFVLDIEKPFWGKASRYGKDPMDSMSLKAVFLEQAHDGQRQFAKPALHLNNKESDVGFYQAGQHFVLALARGTQKENMTFVNIGLEDQDQIARASLEKIMQAKPA